MYIPCVLLPVKRIIAIGDLHGDFNATILSLKKAYLIDDKYNWIGEDTIVVQMGDIVDRGGRFKSGTDEDSEIKIINLFDKLNKQAKLKNGAVYCLLGNHELMNVLGDYSYTSKMGIKHFGTKHERYKYFKPGGEIAIKFAKTRNVIMKIGNIIFVHGGISYNIASKYKIIEINKFMRNYLLGDENIIYDRRFKELFLNQGSLLWTRKYSDEKPNCLELNKTLELMGAKKMIVGHTPQEEINSKCHGCIWRIDVGSSEAFQKKNNKYQVLEILNNGEKINIL